MLVGIVLLVIVVGLAGFKLCDARERSEANHFCLAAEPKLELGLVAVVIVLVVMSRAVMSGSHWLFVVLLTERNALT